MSRRIDANTLKVLDRIEKTAADIADKLQTMDIVEVVRCKDCRFSQIERGHLFCRAPLGALGFTHVWDHDYCSNGVKARENDAR